MCHNLAERWLTCHLLTRRIENINIQWQHIFSKRIKKTYIPKFSFWTRQEAAIWRYDWFITKSLFFNLIYFFHSQLKENIFVFSFPFESWWIFDCDKMNSIWGPGAYTITLSQGFQAVKWGGHPLNGPGMSSWHFILSTRNDGRSICNDVLLDPIYCRCMRFWLRNKTALNRDMTQWFTCRRSLERCPDILSIAESISVCGNISKIKIK